MNKKLILVFLVMLTVLLLYFLRYSYQTNQSLQSERIRAEQLVDSLHEAQLKTERTLLALDSTRETLLVQMDASIQSKNNELQQVHQQRRQLLSQKQKLEAAEQRLLDSLSNVYRDKQNTEVVLEETRSALLDSIAHIHQQVDALEELNQSKQVLRFKSPGGTDITYLGETLNDKAHGSGVGVYANGNIYEGEWNLGDKHGIGIYQWADGEHYEGGFKQDRRHGFGIYSWKNGEVYHGHWKDDRRHGEGIVYDKSGKVKRKGTWEFDKFQEQQEVIFDEELIDSVSFKRR